MHIVEMRWFNHTGITQEGLFQLKLLCKWSLRYTYRLGKQILNDVASFDSLGLSPTFCRQVVPMWARWPLAAYCVKGRTASLCDAKPVIIYSL